MRSLLVLIVLTILSPAAWAEDAGTYVVHDGATPWSDRVGTWELGDVPDSIKGTDPIPQQLCAARTLAITGKPASVTLGVSEADAATFKAKYPAAKDTGDKFTIRHPNATTGMSYQVMVLADPPETVTAGDPAFQAGLVLLKTGPAPATQPTTKP